jgi:hypothetical protein
MCISPKIIREKPVENPVEKWNTLIFTQREAIPSQEKWKAPFRASNPKRRFIFLRNA